MPRKRYSDTGADFHAACESGFEIAGSFIIPQRSILRVQIRTALGVLGELRASSDIVKLCYRGQKEVQTLELVNGAPKVVTKNSITEEISTSPVHSDKVKFTMDNEFIFSDRFPDWLTPQIAVAAVVTAILQ